jgi:hypothetical protein
VRNGPFISAAPKSSLCRRTEPRFQKIIRATAASCG